MRENEVYIYKKDNKTWLFRVAKVINTPSAFMEVVSCNVDGKDIEVKDSAFIDEISVLEKLGFKRVYP